jgi:hypothetical protein
LAAPEPRFDFLSSNFAVSSVFRVFTRWPITGFCSRGTWPEQLHEVLEPAFGAQVLNAELLQAVAIADGGELGLGFPGYLVDLCDHVGHARVTPASRPDIQPADI